MLIMIMILLLEDTDSIDGLYEWLRLLLLDTKEYEKYEKYLIQWDRESSVLVDECSVSSVCALGMMPVECVIDIDWEK